MEGYESGEGVNRWGDVEGVGRGEEGNGAGRISWGGANELLGLGNREGGGVKGEGKAERKREEYYLFFL